LLPAVLRNWRAFYVRAGKMGDAANGLTVCVLIDYQNIHLTRT
jgi:hypothetical protein